MDAGTDPGRAGLAQDKGAGFKEFRVVVLFGDTQAGGEVVWADEDTVEAFFFKDATVFRATSSSKVDMLRTLLSLAYLIRTFTESSIVLYPTCKGTRIHLLNT